MFISSVNTSVGHHEELHLDFPKNKKVGILDALARTVLSFAQYSERHGKFVER